MQVGNHLAKDVMIDKSNYEIHKILFMNLVIFTFACDGVNLIRIDSKTHVRHPLQLVNSFTHFCQIIVYCVLSQQLAFISRQPERSELVFH